MNKLFKVTFITFILLNFNVSKTLLSSRRDSEKNTSPSADNVDFMENSIDMSSEFITLIVDHNDTIQPGSVKNKEKEIADNIQAAVRVLAVGESAYDKNRKNIIEDRSISDSEKEYRIFQNTLLDQLGGEIDLGSNVKFNLEMILKEEYIEVNSRGNA